MGIPDKQIIFLVTGKAGVGKTSFAIACNTICFHMAFKSKLMAFADEIKNTAQLLGWDRKKDERGRRFLLELGKAGRNYYIDMWAKHLFDKVDEFTDFVFVDDWRFDNEYRFFKRIVKESKGTVDLYLVKIESPERESLRGTSLYTDESEVDLNNLDPSVYNYVINNEGTLEDLYNKALDVIKDVKKNLKIW